METITKINIEGKIEFNPNNSTSWGVARLVKADFLRRLLFMGRNEKHLKRADFLLRLVKDDMVAYLNSDRYERMVELLANDVDGQYIYVACYDNRLSLRVISTINYVEGDEIDRLARIIEGRVANREMAAKIIERAERLSAFDVAGVKTIVDEYVIKL